VVAAACGDDDDDSASSATTAAAAASATTAAGGSATTAAGGSDAAPPVDFEHAFNTAVVGPGESLTTTFDQTAGKYVFLCFITDRAGGPPHAIAHDMIQEVDVS
jgi:hypothetical protein